VIRLLSWAIPLFLLVSSSLMPLQDTGYDLLDPAEMRLAVNENGTRFSWQLKYGQARRRVIAFLDQGKPEKALRSAKAQFLICPLDKTSIRAAILSVSEALIAVDGDRESAKAFEQFVQFGPVGADGRTPTSDDLTNPLADVEPYFPKRTLEDYARIDESISARAAMGAAWQGRWYETERIFARLDGGDFEAAATQVAPLLAQSAKYPADNIDGEWQLQRNQDILDRIAAALGVIYRASHGTTNGVDGFVHSCFKYARYGPAGKDKTLGTGDDLKPPL